MNVQFIESQDNKTVTTVKEVADTAVRESADIVDRIKGFYETNRKEVMLVGAILIGVYLLR
jgi:hypothetical protein